MSSALTLAQLLHLLGSGKLLLLPSSRAARELRSAFDAYQRALGFSAWEPAAALSWQQWTGSLWSNLVVTGSESRLLLNAAQEHNLWRDIVRDDAIHRTLGSLDTLAELAQSAWTLAAAYNATADLRGAGFHHDSRIFSQWAREFGKRCVASDCLSSALLEDALKQHIVSGALAPPQTLQLVGFGELSPAQESLLGALRERGTTIESNDPAADPDAERMRGLVTAANPREEVHLAARWVRLYLEDHRDSHPRVAILMPNLSEESAELESVLMEVLAPELQSIAADLSSMPWEIAATTPLASLQMISVALDLARWTLGPLTIERTGGLLLSPYLGCAEDRSALARFDARTLRRQILLRPEIDIPGLLLLLGSRAPDAHTSAAWLREVQSLCQRAEPAKPRSYADWMEHIRALLTAALWPAGANRRSLTAAEFETTSTWDSVLDMVSTLDFSGQRVSFRAALDSLELQAQQTLFSSPATHAPVQVMSVAEAEGCIFDAIVFLRATEGNWPPPEHTHPLLPWSLQRALAMPGTNAAHSTGRARAFTTGLLERSGSFLVTYAAEDGDGKLRPSPLLRDLALKQLSQADLLPAAPTMPHVEPETVPDDTPLPSLIDHEIKGGATVLQAQAACGFQAFARFRLNAQDLDTMDLGFSSPEIGSRLHSALQLFWKQVETQEGLRAMPRDEREQILRQCVGQAMAQHLHPRGAWDEAYLELQKQRMVSLLLLWLDEELRRSPFQVRERETDLQVNLGPLTLDVRFDRIDMLEEGFVLVDYKTGISGHPKEWEGPRPDSPQLPLYALLDSQDELRALTFAKVRTGDMKWLGYQSEPRILPPSKANEVINLQEKIPEWRMSLTQLAQDFADGIAAVAPKQYPQTCERCTQRLLCRLDPATLAPAEETGEESKAHDE